MKWLLLLMFSIPSWAGEFCDQLKKRPEAFRMRFDPIIGVGASVSAGYGGVKGPAERLAEVLEVSYGNYAVSGATSSVSLQRWQTGNDDCGLVVGIDTFFWDTAKGCASDAVPQFIKMVKQKRCERAIFANVPKLVPFQKSSCLKSINGALEDSAGIDVLQIYEELRSASRRAEYFREDRIHLTEAGAEAALEKLCEALL